MPTIDRTITYQRHPGKPLVAVLVDGKRIGDYEIIDGGFLPQGRRTPRKREADAQYLVIVDEAHRRLKAALRLMDSVSKTMFTEEIEAVDALNETELEAHYAGL